MELIIIIGLPGSGKSALSSEYELQGYKIYDDFLERYYESDLIMDLQHNIKLCINDPRLCNFYNFKRIYNDIMKRTFLTNCNIKIIMFENNLFLCEQNIRKREHNSDINKIKRLTTSIMHFSIIYHVYIFVHFFTVNNIEYDYKTVHT